jgi:hypothetical protein
VRSLGGRRRSKDAQALSPLLVAISCDDVWCAAQLLYNGKLTCDEFSADKNTCLSYFIHVDVTPTPAWSTTAYVRNLSTAPRRALSCLRVSVLVLRAAALDVTTELGVALQSGVPLASTVGTALGQADGIGALPALANAAM